MKYQSFLFIGVYLFFLASCGKVTPTPNSINNPTASPIFTVVSTTSETITPQPTNSPNEIATLLARTYPTIPAHPNYPTAEVPEDRFYQSGMYVKDIYLGKYIVRKWGLDGETDGFIQTVTISTSNQLQIEITSDKVNIHYLSGSDVTGNGTPDLILETAGGQSNSTQIYDLGDVPNLILNIKGQFPDSHAHKFMPEPSKFADLDGNGTLEYIVPSFFWDIQELDLCFYPYNHLIFEYDTSKNKYIYATAKFYNYTQPTEITIKSEFKDEQEKYYAYCQLASNYAVFGDFSTSKLVLYNNLKPADAEKAEKIVHEIFSGLGMDVP